MLHARNLAIAVLLATLSPAPAAEPVKPSPDIKVEGQRLTFDPRRCSPGTAMFYWGLGSARVTVKERRQGRCVFDYQWEVEGAGSYVVHRVRVPVASGPVVIDAERKDKDPKHHWSYIYTTFTKDQATLIRSAGHGWLEDRIDGTDQFVAYQEQRPGSRRQPAKPGERVTLQFTVFAGKEFAELAPGARQGQTLTRIEGKAEGWPWLRIASAGMSPLEVRRIRLPVRAASGARHWHPTLREPDLLYLEMKRLGSPGK